TFLVLTALTFSLFGFIIGIWADGFEKLQMIPMLVVTPLTFLGGSFYSVNMLPSGWRTITMLNPVVYLISGFRWSFYEIADVPVALSLGMTLAFLAACMAMVWWIFRTGCRLKNCPRHEDERQLAKKSAPRVDDARLPHWNQCRIPGIVFAGGTESR